LNWITGLTCKSVLNLLEKNLSDSSVLQAGACRDAGIAQSIYQTPERDSNIPSANCNKRQAIESNMQGKVPKSEILEPVKSSSTGTICSCDEWSATLAEARAKEQGEALGRKIEDNMPKDSTRESVGNGEAMGADMKHFSLKLDVSLLQQSTVVH
jgi:hypothetical protein